MNGPSSRTKSLLSNRREAYVPPPAIPVLRTRQNYPSDASPSERAYDGSGDGNEHNNGDGAVSVRTRSRRPSPGIEELTSSTDRLREQRIQGLGGRARRSQQVAIDGVAQAPPNHTARSASNNRRGEDVSSSASQQPPRRDINNLNNATSVYHPPLRPIVDIDFVGAPSSLEQSPRLSTNTNTSTSANTNNYPGQHRSMVLDSLPGPEDDHSLELSIPSTHASYPPSNSAGTHHASYINVPPRNNNNINGRRESDSTLGAASNMTAVSEQMLTEQYDPILLELNELCAAAYRPIDVHDIDQQDAAEESWDRVREWLCNHSTPLLVEAIDARDQGQKTVLHYLAINDAPLDILDHLLLLPSTSITSLDAFGWTPLHYASACSSDPDFVKTLADLCPPNKIVQNNKGYTPLHLAMIGSPQGESFREDALITAVLSNTGAANLPNQEGLMPLHYACAFGASEEVLRVLIDAFPDAMTVRDRFGRNPLHFALANMTTAPKAAPKAVRLLLHTMPSLVNPDDNDQGQNPFLFLLNYVGEIHDLTRHNSDEQRESIKKCLTLLLDAKPESTPTIFTALRGLPPWLCQDAILHETVQVLLNQKIKDRIPTATLMVDFFVQFMVIFVYSNVVIESIDNRFDNDSDNDAIATKRLLPLYAGATYFCVREVTQIMSLIFLRSFREFVRLWLVHPEDWVDTSYVVLVYFWAGVMNRGSLTADDFRVGAGVSAIILWVKLLLYLRSISIDFAVFITGSFYVVKRLLPYLIVVLSFIGCFTFMFHTVFQQTDYCLNQPNSYLTDAELTANLQCEQSLTRPFCTRRSSFLKVLTMLLGQVDEDDFDTSQLATWMYAIFMFVGVILLATILIAIVTDSYKIIQDNEAVAVFYTNRLDFIAETDAISNIPLFQWITPREKANHDGLLHGVWQASMYLWEFHPDESTESFFRYRFVPLALSCLLIPLWCLVGFVTAGWLWPPQIRENLFSSTVWHRSASAQAEDALQEYREQEEKKLQKQVKAARENFYQGLAENRVQYAQIKASVTERKQEMQKECKEIKRIITNLFEQQASFSEQRAVHAHGDSSFGSGEDRHDRFR